MMNQEKDTHNTKKRTILFLFLIFLIALSIRFIGIRFGHPLLVHPDEENVVHSAYNFSPQYDLEKITFNRPAQVQAFLTSVAMRIFSKVNFKSEIKDVFYLWQFSFYLVSRLLVAVLGAFIPIVAFFIGKEIKPSIAWLSAILFCFLPSFVRHSHYATPDIPLTLWIMLAMLFAIKYAKGAKESTLWLAIFFCAVSTADKYPGVISLVMVAGAVLWRFLDKRKAEGKFDAKGFVGKGFLCFFIFVIALFLVAPFLFIRYKEVIEALIFEGTGGHLGRDGLSYPLRVLTFLNYFLTEAGWLVTAFSVLGIVGFIRDKAKYALFLLFSLVFLLAISVVGPHHERWALPVYIGLLFCAAYGIDFLIQLSQRKSFVVLAKAFAVITLLLFAIAGLSQSFWLKLQDTRVKGLYYLEKMQIAESDTYYDGYTPFAPNYFPEITKQDPETRLQRDYVVLSSFYYERYHVLDDEHQENRFYADIRQQGELMHTIMGEPCPYKIKDQIRLFNYWIKGRLLKQETETLFTGPDLYFYRLRP